MESTNPDTDDFRPGRYRHFKGNEYELLCLARHSETREELVIYRALYGEFGVWARPKSMWNELVERDGKRVKRFAYIGAPGDGDGENEENGENGRGLSLS